MNRLPHHPDYEGRADRETRERAAAAPQVDPLVASQMDDFFRSFGFFPAVVR